MVAVNNTYFIRRRAQMPKHNLANSEKYVKFRGFMIFPIERMNVIENLIINLPATDIDNLIVARMVFGEELSHSIDGIAI